LRPKSRVRPGNVRTEPGDVRSAPQVDFAKKKKSRKGKKSAKENSESCQTKRNRWNFEVRIWTDGEGVAGAKKEC